MWIDSPEYAARFRHPLKSKPFSIALASVLADKCFEPTHFICASSSVNCAEWKNREVPHQAQIGAFCIPAFICLVLQSDSSRHHGCMAERYHDSPTVAKGPPIFSDNGCHNNLWGDRERLPFTSTDRKISYQQWLSLWLGQHKPALTHHQASAISLQGWWSAARRLWIHTSIHERRHAFRPRVRRQVCSRQNV